MPPERLRRLLGDPAGLESEWNDFRERAGGDDPVPFALWLASERRMTVDQLRSYLSDPDLHVTTSLADRAAEWERIALLGRGAMGQVFVARDARLHRNLAVKELDPAHADDPVSRASGGTRPGGTRATACGTARA